MKAVTLTPVLKAGVIALFLAIPESGLVSPSLSYNIKTSLENTCKHKSRTMQGVPR